MKLNAQIQRAWEKAIEAQKNAYAPYSRYKVGSCLVAKNRFYTGSNVENASYGATICAERSAILHAVSSGIQNFDSLIIVTKNAASPCGLCLQVIAEFCDENFPVYLGTPKKLTKYCRLKDLIKSPFRKGQL